MPQSDSTLDIPLSSYKGRDDEVDFMECFEEMEKVVLEYKANRENKINELMSDKSLQAIKITDLEEQLGILQQQLCELNKVLTSVDGNQEANNQEMRTQLEIA